MKGKFSSPGRSCYLVSGYNGKKKNLCVSPQLVCHSLFGSSAAREGGRERKRKREIEREGGEEERESAYLLKSL